MPAFLKLFLARRPPMLLFCFIATGTSSAAWAEGHVNAIGPSGPGADKSAQEAAGLYLYLAHPDLDRFRPSYLEGLSKDYVDGIALVVRWDRLEPKPGIFDWSDLDRWVVPTISIGKKLSIGVIAGFFTPKWLYQAGYDVPKNDFAFDPSNSGKTCQAWSQPSVWNPVFLHQYAAALTALADHLRQVKVDGKAAGSALEALTVIKLSGINNTTEELRVDSTRPDTGPCRQSDASSLWAKAGFTPERLIDAVKTIGSATAKTFPKRELGLAIIHKFAFPEIDDEGRTHEGTSIPDEVTARILRSVVPIYGKRLLVQWNALWQGAPPPEVVSARNGGASLGWQMNGFLGAWGGSGCIYPHWEIGPCKSAQDFHSILENGLNLGATYIEIQIGSVLEKAWQPAFEAAHIRLQELHVK